MSDTSTPSLRIQPKLKHTDVVEVVWGGQPLAHLLRLVCSTKMANDQAVVRIFDFIGWIC